jgi:ABC-type lipoprotein export system ATPase subunit
VDGLDDAALTNLRREQVGFIFQGFNLVPVMNVADNVEYPLLLLGRPAGGTRASVADDPRPHRGLAAFAGGCRMRSRAASASAWRSPAPWSSRPALVIADEPTANLDSHTAQQIVDLLRELSHERGAAVVVATHDERMSAHCDRVLRLADGELDWRTAMKWILFAWKNVMRNKRRSLTAMLITAMGTAAVLIGGGFALFTYESLEEMTARDSGHVVLAPRAASTTTRTCRCSTVWPMRRRWRRTSRRSPGCAPWRRESSSPA